MEALVQHVSRLSDDQVSSLTIQDVALAKTWILANESDGAARSKYKAVPEKISVWLRQATVPADTTEGRRQQWLLRELIDELEADGLEPFQPDELLFLLTTFECADEAASTDLVGRVRELLEPHVEGLSERLKEGAVPPQLPALCGRLLVVGPEHIEQCKPRDVKVFAGIESPMRGPVLTVDRHVRILGSVPEGCAVVVENGACCVEGYVMGRIAARHDCEVRENISGMVIVREGWVRARQIVSKAIVVAKWRGVHCRGASDPELVFGGEEIRVHGDTMLGKFIAPTIHVDGKAAGGEFHVTELLDAYEFVRSDERPLDVVLRREIGCEDFGEAPAPKAKRLMWQAARLRARLRTMRDMATCTESELEHYAGSAVLFLVGGDDSQRRIQDLDKARRRLGFLERILSGLYDLSVDAQRPTAQEDGEDDAGGESFELLDSELSALKLEGEVDEDLSEEADQVASMRKEMLEARRAQRSLDSFLPHIQGRTEEWDKERRLLIESIAGQEAELGGLIGRIETLQGAEGSSKTYLLGQLLKAARSRSSDDPVVQRLHSDFLRFLLRQVNNRRERLAHFAKCAEEPAHELAELREILLHEHQIAVPDHDFDPRQGAQVTGRFDNGIRLYAERFLLAKKDAGEAGIVVTQDSGGQPATFRRSYGNVVAAS
jgi:hypothetical protein